MNEPEIERLLKFFDLITYSGRMMKETPEEDPEFFRIIESYAMFGLGMIECICIANDEFNERCRGILDARDPLIKTFYSAANSYVEWVESKGFIPQ